MPLSACNQVKQSTCLRFAVLITHNEKPAGTSLHTLLL
jgi:hypothetical protein